jgi:hypothetical protein
MPTIGEIARRLGEPIHRVEYAIRSRGIRPSGWAGNARVFPQDSVNEIAAVLHHIQAARRHDGPSLRQASHRSTENDV